MKRLLLVVFVIALGSTSGFAQRRGREKTKPVAVAFFDDGRANSAEFEDFQFFLKSVQEILKRDFPNVEFRVLKRGELLELPDGTGLNLDNMKPALGYVLAARGKRRRVLSGIQSDADFACAASAFFARSSPACPK